MKFFFFILLSTFDRQANDVKKALRGRQPTG